MWRAWGPDSNDAPEEQRIRWDGHGVREPSPPAPPTPPAAPPSTPPQSAAPQPPLPTVPSPMPIAANKGVAATPIAAAAGGAPAVTMQPMPMTAPVPEASRLPAANKEGGGCRTIAGSRPCLLMCGPNSYLFAALLGAGRQQWRCEHGTGQDQLVLFIYWLARSRQTAMVT
ncbi:hypothetical protein DUNSADRAFT_4566 [Dunaliella salina]|uniref:Uncharacterized protein n=1 Tax=Dunaliella salina TaxID=3046 RepID=A0ABQ7GRT8_DUNSA|nr:hypothetical protein DUNSADRAFT_4566 [Dunaliella salina]|eukprot:KAF5837303.1 hypothetical protein DUNSADRAFT_4566 [Dunaliella salina]